MANLLWKTVEKIANENQMLVMTSSLRELAKKAAEEMGADKVPSISHIAYILENLGYIHIQNGKHKGYVRAEDVNDDSE